MNEPTPERMEELATLPGVDAWLTIIDVMGITPPVGAFVTGLRIAMEHPEYARALWAVMMAYAADMPAMTRASDDLRAFIEAHPIEVAG